jgi:hypothetical protein
VSDLLLDSPGSAAADGTQVKRTADELDDLLCRLFADCKSLIVKPVIPGLSHAKILWVQPFLSLGGARPVIVKFGGVAEITEELRRYERYIEPFVGGIHSTVVLDQGRTSHLGGIKYSLVNTTYEQIQHFGKFYTSSDVEAIKVACDRLFFDTCQHWYESPGRTTPCDLTEEYQRLLKFAPDRLQRVLATDLSDIESADDIIFPDLLGGRAFPNPVRALAQQPQIMATYRCITHGDFNQNNILLDASKHAWLIDFERTGLSHYLRDVAQLDAIIRIQLMPPESASLEERLELEEALSAIMSLNSEESLETESKFKNPHVAKAYRLSLHLRDIARKLVPHNLNHDPTEYAAAQFYTTLNMVKFSWLPMIQRKHALISACLMIDHIQN